MGSSAPPSGWYHDPRGGGGLRYWDGARWTEHVQPAPQVDPGATVVPPVATATGPQAHWYPDPTQRYSLRYWDGSRWSEQVVNAEGRQGADPVVGLAALSTQPPLAQNAGRYLSTGPAAGSATITGSCGRCGVPYSVDDAFCSRCAARLGPAPFPGHAAGGPYGYGQPGSPAPAPAGYGYASPAAPPRGGWAGPRTVAGVKISPIPLVGGLALMVSSVLPWVNAPGAPSANAFEVPVTFLFDPLGAPGGPRVGLVLLLIGLAGAALAFVPAGRVVRRLIGPVATAAGGLFISAVIRLVGDAGGGVGPLDLIGFGAYVSIVGGILVAAGR